VRQVTPRRRWQRLWEAAPRQLRFTRAGRVLVGLALATGFAAINTGNNLLFLGWGLVLSSIVLSGLMSEAVIRRLTLTSHALPRARVGETAHLSLLLANASPRVPALAVEALAELSSPRGEQVIAAPCELRLEPGARRELHARFVPQARGLHRIRCLRLQTSYPFGFFEKGRRFGGRDEAFWVMPAAVPVGAILKAIESRGSESATRHAGPGEDFFSLRPYRSGDDPRRIAHRRSARTGRWVVRESEAVVGRAVLLELRLFADLQPVHCEQAIAAFGSVAEALLGAGRAVGIVAPGLHVPVAPGEGQRWRVLMALARLEPEDPIPRPRQGAAAHIIFAAAPGSPVGLGVVGGGAEGPLAAPSLRGAVS
jgi:uncharacterized protein (DUF58 family)